MRALAHPTRIALLEALGLHGPLTATEAARYVGESPSSCSYHLRTLARHGFVEEADGGVGRERPWRARDQGLSIGDPEDPETKVAAQALADLFLERYLARMQQAWATRAQLPKAWRKATDFSQTVMWLTATEARAVNHEIVDIFQRYEERRADPAARPGGAEPVEMLHFSYRTDQDEPTDP